MTEGTAVDLAPPGTATTLSFSCRCSTVSVPLRFSLSAAVAAAAVVDRPDARTSAQAPTSRGIAMYLESARAW